MSVASVLDDMLDELRAKRQEIGARIEVLEEARERLRTNRERRSRAPRTRGVKQIVLDVMMEAGADGVDTGSVLERAEFKGVELRRSTVSSLLSRLVRDKVAEYNGQKYCLREGGLR